MCDVGVYSFCVRHHETRGGGLIWQTEFGRPTSVTYPLCGCNRRSPCCRNEGRTKDTHSQHGARGARDGGIRCRARPRRRDRGAAALAAARAADLAVAAVAAGAAAARPFCGRAVHRRHPRSPLQGHAEDRGAPLVLTLSSYLSTYAPLAHTSDGQAFICACTVHVMCMLCTYI